MDEAHRFSPADSASLMEAVNDRPPLPFPQADRIELWLLDRKQGAPLALLQTRIVPGAANETQASPLWCPFVAGDTDFRAECLHDARVSGVSHRDVLARYVNDAARPHPVARWFVRAANGCGEEINNQRARRAGTVLPKDAFPQMLVSERWPDPTARALVREYHDWHAAALLTHLDLTPGTRRRLEAAACRRPDKLLEVFRLIPQFIDRASLEVALVQARLMQSRLTAEV
jgi:hypothetical protein